MVSFRLASEDDYKSINEFYNRIYKSKRSIEQFYWEFHNGPSGKSIYVIAEDDGKIIGTNCVIPIDLISSDKTILRSGKSEDTLVDPKYRGQKIFYKIYDFLFEKCKEHGIQVIWGFTSAKKPFKKIAFQIPFEHKQALVVNKFWQSYTYLRSLNAQNKILDKLKIFGLCLFSKRRYKTDIDLTTRVSIDEKIVDGVDRIIFSNLSEQQSSFAILQDSKFQEWRVYKNPNYHKIHSFAFYNESEQLKAVIVLNSHPNGVAYINHASFSNEIEKKERIQIVKFVTAKLFDSGIVLIRNWVFDTNPLNSQELNIFKKANYKILNRGISFVWKDLDNTLAYKAENFFLSRISSQGII